MPDLSVGIVVTGEQNATDALDRARAGVEAFKSSLKDATPETEKLSKALQAQVDALAAQQRAMGNSVYVEAQKAAAAARKEIDLLTKAQLGENEAVELTVRSRRELMVMLHEASQGRYKNLAGSAMVLEEGEGGAMGAIKAATAALGGPYVVAAGLAAVATTGVAVALWKASEAEAEMVHKSELLGQTLGVSGEAIRGFQYMAVGTNVTTEEMGRVFGIFEKNLGKNAEKFRELGISARDPQEAFEQVMDKARGMGDALERNNFLNETLGRGWEKVSPIIMQGGEAYREAIEKMRIPEEDLKNFERANNAQIEIDKAIITTKLHAGEAASGVRAYFKEFELGLLKTVNGMSVAEILMTITAAPALLVGGAPAAALLASAMQARGVTPDESSQSASAGQSYKDFMESQSAISEGAQKALDWAHKKVAKDSLDSELEAIQMEFREKGAELKKDSAQYNAFMDDELRAEADVREKWAKKGVKRVKDESVYGTTKADSNFERATGISYGDYSMAHPGGTEADGPGRGASVTKGMAADDQRKAAEDQKKWIKEAIDAQTNSAKITMGWDKAIADARRKEHEEHIKEITKEADLVQGFAARELETTLHGKMTAKQLETDFTNILIQQFAERSTKWIEEEALKLIFSQGATAASTAETVSAASVASAAWAGPSMMASIGTFGGAAATGEAGWFHAMAAGEAFGMAAHASGGTAFGRGIFGESGPEMANPIVPMQITTASHTTTHNVSAPITIHIHGGDQAAILRTIAKATGNRQGVSRS